MGDQQGLRKSGWSWVTSESAGVGVELGISIGVSKGSITLRHPNRGAQKFHFFEVGAGLGLGIPVSLSYSTEESTSYGQVYMQDSFKGTELQSEDIQGFIQVVEFSVSIGLGGSVSAMLLGISIRDIMTKTSWDLINHAPAILPMGGALASLPGVGIMGYRGYLWEGNVIPDIPTLNLLAPNEEVSMSWRNTVKDQVPIIIPGDTLFCFDRSQLKPDAETMLKMTAPSIAVHWGRRILVQGFTDSIGNDPYNMELSLKRAKTVKQWLVAHNVAKASDVYLSGYGKSFPVASNRTREGRAKNRRIEITVLTD